MKLVINKCFGGFGISPLAVKRYAERKGRDCYFFKMHRENGKLDTERYDPVPVEDAGKEYMFFAFDIPNPNEVLAKRKDWGAMTMDERKAHNELYEKHSLNSGRELERNDADLIAVIEELGSAADGQHAELKIVEIPDGVEYEIDEYDGIESVHEKHQVWG